MMGMPRNGLRTRRSASPVMMAPASVLLRIRLLAADDVALWESLSLDVHVIVHYDGNRYVHPHDYRGPKGRTPASEDPWRQL